MPQRCYQNAKAIEHMMSMMDKNDNLNQVVVKSHIGRILPYT